MWQTLDRIERLAAAMKLQLARRVDEVQEWKRAGYPSAAEYLAAKAGSSVAGATDMLRTSTKLASLPVVEDALRAGNCRVLRRWRSPTPRRWHPMRRPCW